MAEDISKIYGSMVFNDKVMHDRLPKPVYKSLHETIQNGTALDEDSAYVMNRLLQHVITGRTGATGANGAASCASDHAKPKVVANAQQSINTIGLDGVLYFLGFKDSYLEERGKL